jgi:hypothetical protein
MAACGKLVTGYNSPDRNNPTEEHWVELRTGYPCSVEVEQTGGHDGPCAAVEQPQTISARSRWMEAEKRRSADLRHLQSGLGEHQARPKTFAESQGTDTAPHPSQTIPCPLCGSYYLTKDMPDHLRQTHGSTATTAQPRLASVPTRAERKHDQPLPVVNDNPAIQDLVIADIEKRKAIGLERYGTLLQAHNGRDALRDAYEEALDLCMYLRQALEEA